MVYPRNSSCDRGSDLTSKDLEQAAFQLGIELDFNPPRTPHLKGTVESFFDGLNNLLATSLPGRTFRSWTDRADYKPDDGPFLTYEALLEVIHLHLVDVYSIAKHPMSTMTRLEMWQDSAGSPPTLLARFVRRPARSSRQAGRADLDHPWYRTGRDVLHKRRTDGASC